MEILISDYSEDYIILKPDYNDDDFDSIGEREKWINKYGEHIIILKIKLFDVMTEMSEWCYKDHGGCYKFEID